MGLGDEYLNTGLALIIGLVRVAAQAIPRRCPSLIITDLQACCFGPGARRSFPVWIPEKFSLLRNRGAPQSFNPSPGTNIDRSSRQLKTSPEGSLARGKVASRTRSAVILLW